MVDYNRDNSPDDFDPEDQKKFHLAQIFHGQEIIIDHRVLATLMAFAADEANMNISLKKIGEQVKAMDDNHPDKEHLSHVMGCAYIGLMMACIFTGTKPTKPKD